MTNKNEFNITNKRIVSFRGYTDIPISFLKYIDSLIQDITHIILKFSHDAVAFIHSNKSV